MKAWFQNPCLPDTLFDKSEQGQPLDFWLLLGIASIAVVRAVIVEPISFLPSQDMGSYFSMAQNPATYFTGLPPHHAQRILPSLVVWLMNAVFGMPIDTAFRVLSGFGFVLAHMLLFITLRQLALSPALAFSTVLLAGTSQWPVDYALRNIWQAGDAWTYTLSIGMFLLCLRNRSIALSAVAIASVFVRQNLPILGVAALLHLAVRNRSLKPLLGVGAIIIAFGLNTLLAGGGAESVLGEHLFGRLVQIGRLGTAVFDVDLLWLFFPFLPLYLIPLALRHLITYWWVAAFSAATIGQALLVAEIAGIENVQRLIMPGIWILTPIAGLVAKRLFVSSVCQACFAATPLTLLASRLLLDGTNLQIIHILRVVPGVAIAGLVVAAWLFEQRNTDKS